MVCTTFSSRQDIWNIYPTLFLSVIILLICMCVYISIYIRIYIYIYFSVYWKPCIHTEITSSSSARQGSFWSVTTFFDRSLAPFLNALNYLISPFVGNLGSTAAISYSILIPFSPNSDSKSLCPFAPPALKSLLCLTSDTQSAQPPPLMQGHLAYSARAITPHTGPPFCGSILTLFRI